MFFVPCHMRCLLVSSLLFESFDQTYHRIMRPFALLSARGETEGRSFSKCLTPLGMMAQGITGGISGNPRMWHLWTYIFHRQLFSCTCWPFPKRFDLSGLALTIFGPMVSVQISCGTYGVIEAGRGAKSTVCTLGWKLHSMLGAGEIVTIKKKVASSASRVRFDGLQPNALGVNLENNFRACQNGGIYLPTQVQLNEKKKRYGQQVCLNRVKYDCIHSISTF